MKKMLFIILLFTAVCLFAQNAPLTLLSPNGGEVWQQGVTYPITWQQLNLTGSVTLQLLSNSTNQGFTIGQNIPVVAGVFQWTIPNSIAPANYYRVRIFLASNPATSFSDVSDAPFSIVGSTPPPPPQQYIQVLSPNGGETWQKGSTYPISWTSAGLEGEVRISLVQANGTADIQIATNVPIESGVFNWTIPATIPSGYGYRVHIVWLTVLTVYFGDLSDGGFSITDTNPPPPSGLTVTSPNGGEIWQAGSMHPITWNAVNINAPLVLKLFNGMNTAPIMLIAENIPAMVGIFEWQIPATIPASQQYYIQISCISPAGVMLSDFSDAPFSITSGANPLVQVLSPNGGEVWQIGETYPITWVSPMLTGIYEVALMQGNAVQPVLVIAPNIPGILQLNWTIPANLPPANNYKIRVRVAVNNGSFDLSDGFFTIAGNQPPPVSPLTVISPNGGELWLKGSTQTISWSYEGTDNTDPGVVNIWLVRIQNNQRFRHIIAQNVPNIGSYEWTIPHRVPNGNGYLVFIRKPGTPHCYDISDAPFSIIGQTVQLELSPNPAHDKVAIRLDTKSPVHTEISIYNLKGQLVRRLSDTLVPTGKSSIEWDGRDSNGQKVHSGVYLIRVSDGTEVQTKRIIMLK